MKNIKPRRAQKGSLSTDTVYANPPRIERNYSGEHFWARGYAVSTAGFEVEAIKKYIHEQDENREGSF